MTAVERSMCTAVQSYTIDVILREISPCILLSLCSTTNRLTRMTLQLVLACISISISFCISICRLVVS